MPEYRLRVPRLFRRVRSADPIPRLALSLALVFAASSIRFAASNRADQESGFVPQAPPQRALGDFDGDGRLDTALIQDRSGERRIAVELSGSSSPVYLEAVVTGLIEIDIDHDGDLDLVAATPAGDVLVWLNDGHGRFTQQQAPTPRGLSSAPVVVASGTAASPAIGVRPPPLSSSDQRAGAALVIARVRPPTFVIGRDVRSAALPPLRAPPASLA